jgi:hypothetical protein
MAEFPTAVSPPGGASYNAPLLSFSQYTMAGRKLVMKLRNILMLTLALACAPAYAQVTPGASPLFPSSGNLEGRCISPDYPSNANFRNVTAPGDIRVLPTDKMILVNKRIPEVTSVIFGRATSKHSAVVIVKDCSGTAQKFVVKISGEIDAGEVVIDGNYGSQGLRQVGDRWMIQ